MTAFEKRYKRQIDYARSSFRSQEPPCDFIAGDAYPKPFSWTAALTADGIKMTVKSRKTGKETVQYVNA